ncbi:unnamed protein product [Rhizoctonia solani]|uniref:DUF6535 domain-containing protein n=1 Tax=Rhizoctonia solani TaxID=456999 RepID=A0A8H2WTY6_9AGAM|nr:unnamed protein product [Rhizoctonia solani]
MSEVQPKVSSGASRDSSLKIGNCNKCSTDQNYDYKLGSDDPFWPNYLNEAEKWDDMMVDKWDKKMETLLLFAALFSAIVTAFVIESSKNLQPDNAAITAAAIVDIAILLRNRSEELPVPQSPDDFKATTNAFIVNFVWFVSLCMSVTVALLAGLVKQWCNMLRWDRTAPPCNQARIRQARLNKLVRWRTGLVISALPVIMDAALCLFLLGLLVFLWGLNYDIYLAALVVSLCTMVFYIGTTLAPCFVSFCPYETAISSRKMWGFCYQLTLASIIWICQHLRLWDIKMEADLTNYMSPCERKEVETASNTVPDKLTADALNWIILHSQKPGPREMAIRAIATLDSKAALMRLVSDPPGIIPQVIQSFTSRFRASSNGNGEVKLKPIGSIYTVSLHGRALTTLIKQSLTVNPGDCLVQLSANQDVSEGKERLTKWGVDHTTQDAVRIRFGALGNLEGGEASDLEAKAWGLVGLSAWNDFIGYDTGLRFDRGKTVYRLAKSLNWSLSPSLRTSVLQTLTKEFSYWAPNVTGEHRSGILSHLIDLIQTPPPTLELQSKLACAVAVLTLGLNYGNTYSMAISCSRANSDVSTIESGTSIAEAITEYYASRPNDLLRDRQPLLLFALTGLMEYYEHCDFDGEAYMNMKKIAEQFQFLDNLGKQQLVSITTSKGVTITINSRAYFVNSLLIYLRQPRTPSRFQDLDKVFTHLLTSINRKRQVWELIEYGPQIIPLVVQILAQTPNTKLQTECLNTLVSYWDPGPALLYSRMLLFYQVLPKLVQIFKLEDINRAHSPILQPMISWVFRKLEEQAKSLTHADNDLLVSCMGRILEFDLLETLIVDVLKLNTNSLLDIPENSPQDSSLASLLTMKLSDKTQVIKWLDNNQLSPGGLLLKKLFMAFDGRFGGSLEQFLKGKASLRKWLIQRESSATARQNGMGQDQASSEVSGVSISGDENNATNALGSPNFEKMYD